LLTARFGLDSPSDWKARDSPSDWKARDSPSDWNIKTRRPVSIEMSAIEQLIEKETAVKNTLKELRQDLKEALESSDYYKAVLETTIGSEYKPSEKAAKAHALKVAVDHFSPKEAPEE